MRLPRFRRLILALGLVAWVGAVYSLWREFIPLAPTYRVPVRETEFFSGITKDGEFAIAPRGEYASSSDFMTKGPLRFWNPTSRTWTRELLTSRDFILPHTISRWNAIITKRSDVARILDASTGRVMATMPSRNWSHMPILSDDGQLVGLAIQHVLSIYRTSDGKLLWSKSGVNNFQFDGDDLVAIDFDNDQVKSVWALPHLFDRWNGVPAAPSPERPGFTRRSPDGRFELVVTRGGRASMRETASGRELCSLPTFWIPYRGSATLSDDSLKIRYVVSTGGNKEFRSVSVLTGTMLEASPIDVAQRVMSPKRVGAFVFEPHDQEEIVAPNTMVRWLAKIGIPWSGIILSRRDWITVRNAPAQIDFGFVDVNLRLIGLEGDGFTTWESGGFVNYYALPPQRNLTRIIGWSLTPPALLWIVIAAWRRWKAGTPLTEARLEGAT